MIKECSVINSNDFVTVVRFNNIDVQFPSIHKNDKIVFVSYENGRYSIVDKKEYDKSTFVNRSRKTNSNKNEKKTTVQSNPIESDLDCENVTCNEVIEH